MKKNLQLNILTDGVLVPMLANLVGKNNSGKELVSLPEIDMLIFSLRRQNEPDYTIRTEYGDEVSGQPFELSVFENDVLVCVIQEREMYQLEENVVLQRNKPFTST